MNDIRIRIFGYGSSTDHKMAFRSWSGAAFEYKNIKIVDDDSYTHVVLYYNGDTPTTPNIKHIPKKNVIAFLHEPFEILQINWDFIQNNVGTCIVHDKSKVPALDCIKEYICYLPPGIPVAESGEPSLFPKIHQMSVVASLKSHLPGHALRHHIIKHILSTDMDIHIWGRGIRMLYNDIRVKGETENKPIMFAPYRFTIAIENAFYPWWVTEKYYDPILVNTIPLYLGASHISDVFGTQSHIQLPYEINGIMDIIKQVYNSNNSLYKVPEARERLLTDLNYQHFLWDHFNNDRFN